MEDYLLAQLDTPVVLKDADITEARTAADDEETLLRTS